MTVRRRHQHHVVLAVGCCAKDGENRQLLRGGDPGGGPRASHNVVALGKARPPWPTGS